MHGRGECIDCFQQSAYHGTVSWYVATLQPFLGQMQQLTLHVSVGADANYLSDLLLELGAYSATVTDRFAGTADEQSLVHAVLEESSEPSGYAFSNVIVEGEAKKGGSPLWSNAVIVAYFPNHVALEDLTLSLLADLDLNRDDHAVDVVESSPVKDEILTTNWVAHVQQQFSAISIGGLFVRAPWHSPSDDLGPAACEIILEPGQAFGTGEHATTQLIANWLQSYAQSCSRDNMSWRVLDYGCGSGILAIAAVLLGAEEAVGCDIDPIAVVTAESNAIANHCSRAARFGTNDFEADVFCNEKRPFPVVVANILAVG